MSASLQSFHLTIPVNDIERTHTFYNDILGCRPVRESGHWIDFDFFGHQLSYHVVDGPDRKVPVNPVDSEQVPVRHFGIVMRWDEWQTFSENLRLRKVQFLIEQTIRFRGQSGEQATLFI